jgi:hypothetical protein
MAEEIGTRLKLDGRGGVRGAKEGILCGSQKFIICILAKQFYAVHLDFLQ